MPSQFYADLWKPRETHAGSVRLTYTHGLASTLVDFGCFDQVLCRHTYLHVDEFDLLSDPINLGVPGLHG